MTDATAHPGGRPAVPRDLGEVGGYRVWAAAGGGAEVRFVGRHRGAVLPAERPTPAEVLAAVAGAAGAGAADAVATLRQIHSAEVLEADRGGLCGEGDALVTDRAGLALSVVTADCVPVLIAAGPRVAAVHAGWRGIVAGVVPATVERLRAGGAGETGTWSAWIGPAIAECCYEVGDEVAERVAAVSSPDVVVPVAGGNPRLDLVAAVRHQLAAAGVPVTWMVRCTKCDEASLWSYRRDGAATGRNLAFIWKGTAAA